MNPRFRRYLPHFTSRALTSGNGLHRLVGNSSWLIGEQLLRFAIGLSVGVVVARYLGPQNFGTLNYALSIASLLAVVSGLGLEGLLIRELVRHPDQEETLLGTAFWLRFGIGSVVWATAVLISFWLLPQPDRTFWLVAIILGGFTFQSFGVIESYFAASVRARYTVLPKGIVALIFAAARLLLVFTHASLLWFALALATETIASAAALAIVYVKRSGRLTQWRFCRMTARSLFTNSWPFLLASIAVTIYTRTDQIILGSLSGSIQVGIFAAAVRLSELWYFVPVAILQSALPNLINARAYSPALYHDRLQLLYEAFLWLALAVAATMTVVGRDLIHALFGTQYRGAGAVLMVRVWSGVFVSYGIIKGRWELIENMQKVTLVCTGLGAAFNVAANLLLVPRYGAVGAAYSTIVAQILSGLLVPLFYPANRQAVFSFLQAFVPRHLIAALRSYA